MIWLLRVDLGSVVWYLSDQDAAPVDRAGTTLAHDPTLSDPEVSYDAVPGTDSAVGDFEARARFLAPVSVAQFEAQGWPLSRGSAELSRWQRGRPYESREIIAIGDVVLDGLPVAGEEIAVSLVPPDPGRMEDFPPAGAVVCSETCTDVTLIAGGVATADTLSYPDGSEGMVYPWVFGRPGLRADATGATVNTPATPAILIDDMGGEEKVLVAGHAVRETTRTVYNEDLDADQSVTSSLMRDGRGRLVSVIDLSGSVGYTFDNNLKVWISWTSGIRWDDGEEIRGLGSTALYLLRMADGGGVHDLGAWQAAAPLLNRLEVGGYIDEIVCPWDVIAGELLALFPRCVVVWGPRGYAPVVFDEGPSSLGPELTEGLDFDLVEDARPEEVSEGGTTTVRVEFSYYPPTAVYLDSVTFGPGFSSADGESASEVARRAYALAGQRSTYTLTSAWLWRRDSAEISAREWLDLLSEPLVRVRAQLYEPTHLRSLPYGVAVRVTSPTLGWSARPCWVGGHWFAGQLTGVRFVARPRAF